MVNQTENIYKDTFVHDADGAYPAGWVCDTDCELPFKQGVMENGRFHLSPVSVASRHIAPVPALDSFELEFECRGDAFFSVRILNIFFHYSPEIRKGYVLRYSWGLNGGRTHYKQEGRKKYQAELFYYDGNLSADKYHFLTENRTEAFIDDLREDQQFKLSLDASGKLVFMHGGRTILNADCSGAPGKGYIAFSRSDCKGALSINNISIGTQDEIAENIVRPETATVFPHAENRILSDYIFKISTVLKNEKTYLKALLEGGPSTESEYPDIERQRFGEKFTNPYIRIEDRHGGTVEKFYIFKGSIGLDEFHWNESCSVLTPADATCPVSREVMLVNFPEESSLFIGYDHYFAEDSICMEGGPAEALIGKDGEVLWSGSRFGKGDFQLRLISPPDKKICSRIPEDIPDYDQALAFARNNHFFIEDETIRFQISMDCRDNAVIPEALKSTITIEDVFGKKISEVFEVSINASENIPEIPGAKRYRTFWFNIKPLPAGIYHINAQVKGLGGDAEIRRAFEVMPENPGEKCAPLASGLPELYPNILSGIRNEHFHPWGAETLDSIHYNSGGNNYFKVVMNLRAPELLRVYGRKYKCWLKPWRTVFEERGIEPNAEIIKHCDSVYLPISRRLHGDIWGLDHYRDAFRFNTLLKFLKSDEFSACSGCILDCEKLSERGAEKGLTADEFKDLVKNHWPAWTQFYCREMFSVFAEYQQRIQAINPGCKTFVLGGTYPPYNCGYKTGHYGLSCGWNLRGGISRYLTGENGFEDYPYSSGYPVVRGVGHLMSSKLEDPELTIFPEVFGINGETLDPRVVLANPPHGRSNPPVGFMEGLFYEYSFAACWFNSKGFNFWTDHGYYPKTWSRKNYAEMLYAYEFISITKPVKPVRAPAYAYSRAACFAHGDMIEPYSENCSGVFNTAEEGGAFAYEQARNAGVQAGFIFRLEDCAKLNPGDVDFLVIPPMCGVDEDVRNAIRELHEQGVGLLGFEDASGLEDLFGIEKNSPETAGVISSAGDFLDTKLADVSEITGHDMCVINYKTKEAKNLLVNENGFPVLTLNRTPYAKTAFFTIPPTLVKRSNTAHVNGGQRSNSVLINLAAAMVQKMISRPVVTTTAGLLKAFEDEQGNFHIIISENRCPEKGKPIRPLVKINLPGIREEDVSCNKDLEILGITPSTTCLKLRLREYESARISICNNQKGRIITK